MTPDQIKARQAACLRLTQDPQSWDLIRDLAELMCGEASTENMCERPQRGHPRAYYQGVVGALQTLVATIEAEAERARTEGSPEAKENDETELMAEVLHSYRAGGGRLAG